MKAKTVENQLDFHGGFNYAPFTNVMRALRRRQTPAEKKFWEAVRNRKFINLKFRRQHRIGFYIVDFYCHEHSLIIELDGGIHDLEKNRRSDQERNWNLESQGFNLLRFRNDMVIDNLDIVLKEILDFLQMKSRS